MSRYTVAIHVVLYCVCVYTGTYQYIGSDHHADSALLVRGESGPTLSVYQSHCVCTHRYLPAGQTKNKANLISLQPTLYYVHSSYSNEVA